MRDSEHLKVGVQGSEVIWYTNACSLRNKWGELTTRFSGGCLVAITETWMHSDHLVASECLNQFVPFRRDREDGRQGGGVLLLVNRGYVHWEAEYNLNTPNIQAVSCSVILGRKQTCILCVYRSPSTSKQEDESLLKLLDGFVSGNQRFVIVGDFNHSEINWQLGWAPHGTMADMFTGWLYGRQLVQHVVQPTRYRSLQTASVLDLVISRYSSDVQTIDIEQPIGKSDHCVLRINMGRTQTVVNTRLRRNYQKMDVDALLQVASSVRWLPDTREPSLEERWTLLKEGILRLVDRFAPLTLPRAKSRPKWWKPSIARAITNRNRLWQTYRTKRTAETWARYKLSRNKTQAMQRQAKLELEQKIAGRVKNNPKEFYSYAQANKKFKEGVGSLASATGQLVHTDTEKALALVTFFKSVFRSPHDMQGGTMDYETTQKRLIAIDITEEAVYHELSVLKTNKAAGPDGLHSAVIRPLASVIAGPVKELFSESLRIGHIPGDWKTADVVAIYKSGPRTLVNNYRPVSLTSVFCKCLERIVRRHMSQHLTENGLLSPVQHGFVSGRSCLTNLLSFLDEVTSRLDEGLPVEVCYLDFRKAFDSVSHNLLLHKISRFGIGGKVLEWITDFLTGRTFRVRVGEALSDSASVTSGVPQGSVLGPLLFLMYVNDLAVGLSNPCFVFADDVKLTGQDLRDDIALVKQWSETWDLPLNLDKCQVLTRLESSINTEHTGIAPVSVVRDLGIKVASDFKWAPQCQFAAGKAWKELFRLCGTVSSRTPEVFIPLYSTIVRPHLEYCVQAWSPYMKKDIACLERVQRVATRMVNGLKHEAYDQRLKRLGLFSLSRRRLRGDLIEAFKIVKGKSGSLKDDLFQLLPGDRTRGHSLRLARTHSRLDVRKTFFSKRVVPYWNRLTEGIIQCDTVMAFKKALDIHWSELFPEVP